MDHPAVAALLREHLPGHADRLIAEAQSCVDLTTTAVDDDRIPCGASKLGGDPDLPPGTQWPRWESSEFAPRPLSFLAQIDLAAMPPTLIADILPTAGLLSFFVDEEEYLGLRPEERSGFRALLLPPSGLERRTPPAGATRFRSGELRAAAGVSLPPFDDMVAEDYDAFDHIVQTMLAGRPGRHQLLGHPYRIQQPPATDVVSTFGEGRPGNWRLLLQIDSDDELDLCWGDVGTYYLMVPSGPFDPTRAWCVFQCS